MKLILSVIVLSYSALAFSCSEISGSYDLPSMKAQCTSDRNYIPGDSSPLDLIFPRFKSSFPRGVEGTIGYVEPNKSLKVSVSKDCKDLTISYFTKNSIFTPENAIHEMSFDVSDYRDGVLTVTSKEKTPYSCEMGICGKMTETKMMILQKVGQDLKLNSIIKTRGIIYMVPFSKVEYPLSCQFRKD